jgi:hypothetical protein
MQYMSAYKEVDVSTMESGVNLMYEANMIPSQILQLVQKGSNKET